MDNFANYVKTMHEARDEPFEVEYNVSNAVWNNFNDYSLLLY